ncbi:MAG: phosphotransferase [Chloroflexota bacterium]|nr:phosphotransferase [Chloroflexota bacterium]
MIREDPGLDVSTIAACLNEHYGLRAASITYLPIGYDFNAAVYEVVSPDGITSFLKIRFGPMHEPGLLVPVALADLGVPNLLASIRTRSSRLWCALAGYPGYTVVLYPFIRGENAMVAGMDDAQWRTFGSTLRAVHDSGLGEQLRGLLPVETFALSSAAKVRRLLDLILADGARFDSPVASSFAAFWRENADRICDLLARAEALGNTLQAWRFDHVLCHADIHAANILVGDDGRIHLIDWDGPLLAPRERDLLFVIGSRIARVVEPREETLFFAGYGPVEIDPAALIYYRYERIVEDLGEFGESVFLDPSLGEEVRAAEAALSMGFFAPGGDVEVAETIVRQREASESR